PRRCHGECEILRPVPDRDATGPRVPPLGSGRQRVHRLLPVLRTADPGTWTSAGGEGATRRPGFHRHDDARDAARTGGGLRRAAAPNLQAGRIDALHRLRDRGDQQAYGVVPDLLCLGKVIGGGLACGAFLGRSDILELADPTKDEFFHSSTFAGYPPAMAAGMATLDELEKPGTFEGLLETSRTVSSGIQRVLSDHSAAVQVLQVGSVFSILFPDRKVRTYRDTLAADAGKRAALDA